MIVINGAVELLSAHAKNLGSAIAACSMFRGEKSVGFHVEIPFSEGSVNDERTLILLRVHRSLKRCSFARFFVLKLMTEL